MDIIVKISEELGVKDWQVKAAVELIDEGCTIPFIARYRKEATGSLNDEELRNLGERLTYLRNLEEKKAQVISAIEESGKTDPGAEKTDRRGADTGVGGGSVPSIPSETPYPCDDRQGKWTGAAGPDDRIPRCLHQPLEEDSQSLCINGKV